MENSNQQRKKAVAQVNNIINKTSSAGDKLYAAWEKNSDLKTIQTAIQSYGTAVSAAKALIIYKKQTGNPERIEFFEGK